MQLYFINKDIKTWVTSVAFLALSALVLKFKKKNIWIGLFLTEPILTPGDIILLVFLSGAQRPLFYGFMIMS